MVLSWYSVDCWVSGLTSLRCQHVVHVRCTVRWYSRNFYNIKFSIKLVVWLHSKIHRVQKHSYPYWNQTFASYIFLNQNNNNLLDTITKFLKPFYQPLSKFLFICEAIKYFFDLIESNVFGIHVLIFAFCIIRLTQWNC